MMAVVDTSVAVKWFIEEDDAGGALLLLDRRFELHAPDLLSLEFDNVLCKLIRRELLSEDEGLDIHDRMTTFPIQYHSSQILRERAFEIAIEAKRSIYDCLYLTLAEALEGRMVTADRKFFQAMDGRKYGGYLLWLGDLDKA
jgi:predicted nucleic acid-binding protein